MCVLMNYFFSTINENMPRHLSSLLFATVFMFNLFVTEFVYTYYINCKVYLASNGMRST
jgi:hypothetical protein